jgi:S1-C subfamily serine protease
LDNTPHHRGTWLETPRIVGQEKHHVPMMSRKQLEEIAEVVRGVPVLGCLPGSSAAEAGIGYGDIVLSVNGVDTPTIVEYLQARRQRSDGYVLRLFRGGAERTVWVEFRPPSDPFAALALQIANGRYITPDDPLSVAPPKSLPS